MFNGFLKQSTASQTRIVGPFIDDTDFKTLETGLTIANTDVKLSKNGAASANKNSGGGTHIVNGKYALTFDATDTNTVGELDYSIAVSGALVVTGKFMVLEEAIYDALFGASAAGFNASGQVAVGSIAANAITATAIASSAITSTKFATGAITSTVIAADAIGASELAADAVAEIADAVWDEAQSGHVSAGSFGEIATEIAAILADTAEIGAAGAGLTEAGGTGDHLTALATAASLTAVAGDVTAILADTNELQTDWANGGRLDLIVDGILEDTGTTLPAQISGISSPSAATIAAAVLAAGDIDGYSLEEAHKLELAALVGKLSGADGTTITIRAADDSKARITATVDSSGNRTAVALSETG